MPPARRIFIDTDRILTTVAQLAARQHGDAVARMEGIAYREDARQEILRVAQWVPRDLPRLLGQPLTGSQRKRAQEALRCMEAAGLVALDSRHVRLTEAGAARVKALARATARDVAVPPAPEAAIT